jgi:primase-polymerase (primpol)-like protein
MKMTQRVLGLAVTAAALALGSVANAQSGQDTVNQNMNNANEVYNRQQQQQERQQMQTYQNRAGNFNPGLTDVPAGRNTWVSPSYNNGTPGVTVTHTYK